MLTYILFRLGSAIVPLLPLRLGYRLVTLLADIAYWCQPRVRHNVESNLHRVLGPTEDGRLRETVRGVFRSGARNYYDLFRIPRLNLAELTRIVTVHGWEYLEQALQGGRGVIIVSAHLGNFDLVAQMARVHSYSITIPVEHVKPQCLFELVNRTRASKGLRLIPLDQGALKAVQQALRRNEIVGLVVDRDIQQSGVSVRFFGETTKISNAPVVLSLRTGARILPARSERLADHAYAVHIYPPLELEISGNPTYDTQVNTQRIATIIEEFIRQEPDQWVVFEPIWAD
ncbi:MAG: hypothetical protein M1136_05740 [Chloroflexi bacterium]|nr:hypothetical protein [Chloroflexota bacterium]MCL5075140.1 hypothetical protein [Chloroflexota bacterium]